MRLKYTYHPIINSQILNKGVIIIGILMGCLIFYITSTIICYLLIRYVFTKNNTNTDMVTVIFTITPIMNFFIALFLIAKIICESDGKFSNKFFMIKNK
jgi:hypothetical protein